MAESFLDKIKELKEVCCVIYREGDGMKEKRSFSFFKKLDIWLG